MRTVSTAALAAVVICAGCATPSAFQVEKVEQLRPGATTIAEAEQLLGPATARSNYGNGTTLLQWMHTQGGFGVIGAKSAHVSVLFNQSGRMVRVAHKSVIGS